jgi:hypothetical protein
MSKIEIMKYAKKMTEAISCLRKEKHHIPAIMLVYIAIDHFAWTSISTEKSNPKDFQECVTKYMLSKNPIGCTAGELWASRNGLIHMGTAESAAHFSGSVKNKILYTVGRSSQAPGKLQDVVYVNAEDFIESFITGVLWFISDIENDSAKLNTTLEKLKRMLVYVEV